MYISLLFLNKKRSSVFLNSNLAETNGRRKHGVYNFMCIFGILICAFTVSTELME